MTNAKLFLGLLVGIVLLACCGCSGAGGKEQPAASPLKLELATWEQVQEVVAKSEGKVVVLDLWSTACSPCVRELPGLVKLAAKHEGRVVCLTFNCDFTGAKGEKPADGLPLIGKVLADKGFTGIAYVSSEPDDNIYQKSETSTVPVVLVYDQNGKLKKRFEEDGSYGKEGFGYEKQIGPLVEELLK